MVQVTGFDILVWNAAIRPVLTYGINCIHVSKTCLARMETLQAKLLKAGIGVHKWSRSSPILKALNIKKIETTIDISSLDLGRSILCNGSRDHFQEQFNNPAPPLDPVLMAEAASATPDPSIDSTPPTADEISAAIRKLKTNRAPESAA